MRLLLGVVLLILSKSLLGVDCNGNGSEDADDTARGISEDCNTNGIPDECERLPLSFGLRFGQLPVGKNPGAVVAGDFNGDGTLDLATANGGSDSVSVLLNSAAGGFGAAVELAVGSNPRAVVAADFNGDGDLDLVAANRRSGDVSVLLGKGDGTFDAAASVPAGTQPLSMGVGDFNADGSLDLATANRRSNDVSILLGRGDGTFQPALSLPCGSQPISLTLGDFNADGLVDFATANNRSDDVSVFLGQGQAAFEAPTHLIVGSASLCVAAGDVNGDSRLDLIVASQTTADAISFLLGNGDGTFEFPVSLARELRPVCVLATDLDGDGGLDLAVANPAARPVSLLRNNGVGDFVSGGMEIPMIGGPVSFAAGDFDGDADTDLALANYSTSSVFVLYNNEADSFPLTVSAFPIGERPHTGVLADLDGDGDFDVATGNGGSGVVSLIFNAGDGTFAAPVLVAPGGWFLAMAAADFDHDGSIDLVVLDHSGKVGRVLLNRGDGTFAFTAEANFRVTGRPSSVTTVDLDNDGALDLLSASITLGPSISVLRGRGDGSFIEMGDLIFEGAVSMVPGDFDGDGDFDVALADQITSAFLILSNLGEFNLAPAVSYPVFGRPVSATAGDYDGDGDLDLAVAGQRREVSVLLNGGDGVFGEAVAYTLDRDPFDIGTADVDGDGDVDLVTADAGISILVNQGDGSFAAPLSYGVGREPREILAGDLNGDGKVDLASPDRESLVLTVLLQRGPQPFPGDSLATICTDLDFSKVSIESSRGGAVEGLTKYTLPADPADDSLLPTVFQNVREYPLHQEFLGTVLPQYFPDLTAEFYDRLTGRRATRRYFVGVVERRRTTAGPVYGFNVLVNPDPGELLTLEEVRGVHETLSRSFQLGPLGYAPDTPEAREAAESWRGPGFPLYFPDSVPGPASDYEAYTVAIGFGGVRLLSAAEFAAANGSGQIGVFDIIVLERAPRDIEGVVAGVITAERQGELSHVAIRTARRGTPNAFVGGALEKFAALEGKLVRLEVQRSKYLVREATLEEAQAFREANQPMLSELPGIDPDFAALSSLAEIATLADSAPETRFGGKASNLARLQGILTGSRQEYGERGFAIPLRYYLEFMDSNHMPSEVDGRLLTYTDYLQELFTLPRFQVDSRYRFAALETFRDTARGEGVVDDDLVARLHARIEAMFSRTTAVRFRSSSNVEDALEFNGAGLYESTGACVADLLDDDDLGPSQCDPDRQPERGVIRALKKVWTSLWTFRAVEERAFFLIPEDRVAMGILVNRAFKAERANGVAFTGNPSNPLDRRYTVVVQVGEESVVSPNPGVLAEKDLLEVVDGEVVRIDRPPQGSSLLPPGEWVLSDEELGELGALLWHIDENFPIDLGEAHERQDVLLDIEFKIESTGELAVKQVRPFLNATPSGPTPSFELAIPAGTLACGVFVVFREPRQEYELKSTVLFVEGAHVLPTSIERFSGELFEEVRVGPSQEHAVALEPGLFKLTRLASSGEETLYRFEFEQEFELPSSSERFALRLSSLEFRARGEVPVEASREVDEDFLRSELVLRGGPLGESGQFIVYSSCVYESLPRWRVDIELEGGDSITLRERFEPPTEITLTGPAALAGAALSLGAEQRELSEYWDLVYAAGRHNVAVRYWSILDPPLVLAGVEKPVFAVEVVARDTVLNPPIEEAVHYLGEDFEVIATPRIVSYAKVLLDPSEDRPFRRGDANADGVVEISDVIFLLDALFRAGVSPECLEAADGNGDGRLNVSDPVAVLLYLFGGRDLPEPFEACGLDPTPDGLGCEKFANCPS